MASSVLAPQLSMDRDADVDANWKDLGLGCCEGEKVWGGFLGSKELCRQLCIDTPQCNYALHGWSGMGSSFCEMYETCITVQPEMCRGSNSASVHTFQMLKREGVGRPVHIWPRVAATLSSQGLMRSLANGSTPLKALDFVGGNVYEKAALFSAIGMSIALVQNAFSQINALSQGAGMVVAAAIGILFGDFFTGMLHWATDNYGSKNTPLFGPVIDSFQEHHESPWTLTYRPPATNMFAIVLSTIPLLAGACILALFGKLGPGWALAVVLFANLQFVSQEVHKYTHMKRVSRRVSWLQKCGFILSKKAHLDHHKSPYGDNYCIWGLFGLLNRVLDKINFWRRLELLVYRCTGNEPMCWKLCEGMKEGVLRGDYESWKTAKKNNKPKAKTKGTEPVTEPIIEGPLYDSRAVHTSVVGTHGVHTGVPQVAAAN